MAVHYIYWRRALPGQVDAHINRHITSLMLSRVEGEDMAFVRVCKAAVLARSVVVWYRCHKARSHFAIPSFLICCWSGVRRKSMRHVFQSRLHHLLKKKNSVGPHALNCKLDMRFAMFHWNFLNWPWQATAAVRYTHSRCRLPGIVFPEESAVRPCFFAHF